MIWKNTFDSCVHPHTFVTERKAWKDVYFMHNLAERSEAERALFSLARAALKDVYVIHNFAKT
jgi:hypothetical protein